MFSAGGHCEQLWHGQGCPLFDVRPAFLLPTMVLPTKEEVGRQHQGMDRPRVRQVPEGSGEQGKMKKTGCKIICGAPTTLAVTGLMMMMLPTLYCAMKDGLGKPVVVNDNESRYSSIKTQEMKIHNSFVDIHYHHWVQKSSSVRYHPSSQQYKLGENIEGGGGRNLVKKLTEER